MLATFLTILKLAAAVLATGLLPVQGVEPPADASPPPAPESAPQPEEQPGSPPPLPMGITNADDLLLALEHANTDLRLLSADLSYSKTFAIQGDTQTRIGALVFESRRGEQSEAAPLRRFGITFTQLRLGDRIEDETTGYRERYAFDGEWLAEVYPKEKQFIRRQVVRPGERWDPLKIGEGPFPIPIQQRREDILARFNAELSDETDMLDSRPIQLVAGNCYQLKLTPRADAGESDLREIRIWYEKDTLLPRIARTVSTADDVSLVLLKNLAFNADAKVSEADLSTEPPADRAGWNIRSEPWQG